MFTVFPGSVTGSEPDNQKIVDAFNFLVSENPIPKECPFSENSTSSDKLCELWCSIIKYNDSSCIYCPDEYKNDAESEMLCNLHSELEIAMHPSNIQLTTVLSGSFQPVICKHKNNPTSSEPLCNLWCQIKKLDGEKCIECPESYQNLTQTSLLCDLNEELQLLDFEEKEESTTITMKNPVDCIYKYEENSDELCGVWCKIQDIKVSA